MTRTTTRQTVVWSDKNKETPLKSSKDENVKVLFHSMLPNFRISTALWKVPRPRPFVPVRAKMYMKMTIGHWWDDDDRGKPKYLEKNLSPCHFVQYIFHMD
jgi:hypothetical protein